jgi:hypothetical protein
MLEIILVCSVPHVQARNHGEIPGFTVHADKQICTIFRQLFPEYVRKGADWTFQDSNSLFVHVIGDSRRFDGIHLFPGKYPHELEEETQKQGVVFWTSRPSLLWISAKDTATLSIQLRENTALRQMIDEVAHNPYINDSYANITGKDEPFPFEDFHAIRVKHAALPYMPPPEGRHVAGIYDLETIHYHQPARYYLGRGLQSTLKDEYLAEIREAVGPITQNLFGVLKLLRYYQRTFERAGIKDYRVSANDLYALKRIDGCTEEALY